MRRLSKRLYECADIDWLAVLALIFLLLDSPISNADDSQMVVKYARKIEAVRDARDFYRYELIQLIFEQTRPEYGDYQVETYVDINPGVKRNSVLLSQGERLNVMWNSPGSVVAKADVIAIPIDIFKGLLGYRICLINRHGKAAFNRITDVQSLNTIRIGQDSGWSDFDIYTFNQVKLTATPSLDGLISMLAVDRIDCLPLGAIEVEAVYQEKKAQMPMLDIETTLLIYYDFPTYFFVSKKYPLLAQRFLVGLQKIQKNGMFDALFNRYYQHKFDSLHIEHRQVICLKSPYLPSENQCQHVEQIIPKYQAIFTHP